MLIWMFLSCGVALGAIALICVRAMMVAERRARRSLYAALGLSEEQIALLLTQKGSIATQLARMRETPVGGRPDELADDGYAKGVPQQSFRFTRAMHEPRGSGAEGAALAPARHRPRTGNGRDAT